MTITQALLDLKERYEAQRKLDNYLTASLAMQLVQEAKEQKRQAFETMLAKIEGKS